MRATVRLLAVSVILSVCLFAGTTSLPFIIARLGAALPFRIYAMQQTIAAVALEPDGRLVMHLTSKLLRYENADMLAFIYLHELGHVRLGHLQPQGQQTQFFAPSLWRVQAWRMEYDADKWAASRLPRLGYNPVRGIVVTFEVFGDGGGFSHPPDRARIDRIRNLSSLSP